MRRLFGLLAITAALCPAADLYPVAGTIINAAANTPLPHAWVRFLRQGASRDVVKAVTGTDGRFAFQLPAGSFLMLAGTRQSWESYGSRTPANALGSAVIVGPGKDTSAIVFRFFPPSVITGRVLDEAGEPAPQALVQLIGSTVRNGRRSASVLGWRRTGDLGEYRFDRLAAGVSYYLAVTGEPWYASRGLAVGATESETQAAYRPVYYPDADDPAKAAPITPTPGEEVHADFRLTLTSNATVNLHYSPPPGLQGTATLYSDGIAGTSGVQQVLQVSAPAYRQINPDGSVPFTTLSFRSVPPGHYTLRLTGIAAGQGYDSSVLVLVNGSDVSAEMDLKHVSRIEGNFQLPPGVVPKAPVTIAIRGAISGAVASVRVHDDGTFVFPNVQAGHFTIFTGSGYFVTGLDAAGGAIKDGLLQIPDETTAHVTVSLSSETGIVRGIVAEGGRPLEGATVVLMGVAGQTLEFGSEDHDTGYQTESDGSFVFGAVPPGKYRIIAIENPDLEYRTPQVLAPYLPAMREIEVKAHAAIDLQLPMIAAPH
ncbi:MAG TPA: carboxypeptidase-like regulatory domain-containing protein [Bryobacteraceae bacterium]|nr:carboxypeptidase-like regulatory domain-containing protein [Bryobacteraceae bacterium]